MDIPLLSVLVLHGVLSAGIMLLMRRSVAWVQKAWAILLSLFGLGGSYFLWCSTDGTGGFQWVERVDWIPMLGSSYHLGVDGIAVGLIVLTFLVVFFCVASIVCTEYNHLAEMFALVFFTQAMTIGVFCALDGLLFYFFWEAGLLPMYMYIGVFGGDHKRHATCKYFLFTFLGSVIFLVGILYLGYHCGEFSLLTFSHWHLTFIEQCFLFMAFTLAFAIKLPMFPLHSWLPDAHTQAPTAGSMLLAAILLKLGGYGFLRFNLPITPDASFFFAPLMIGLSLVSIVYIGLVALTQMDIKRLIAYGSISHMGMVTLGIFLLYLLPDHDAQYRTLALSGAVTHMIGHGLSSAALFLSFGMLYTRMGSRSLSEYGGMMRVMPIYSAFFMLFILSNIGFPGTAGFVGEFLILLSAVATDMKVAAIAALTMLLSAAYSLRLVKTVFYGGVSQVKALSVTDIDAIDKAVLMGLSVVILGIGLYPQCVVSVIETSVADLLQLAIATKI